MSLPQDPLQTPPAERRSPASNRAIGTVRAGFVRVGARTEVVGPYETGGYRLRLPRSRDATCDAVVVNTGGGMAGGDHAAFAFDAGDATSVTLTTTAAEKVYRGAQADGDAAETGVDVALSLARGARLDWLPQETILFDGARLVRRLTVDMAADAELLMAEMLVFGRLGMGERMTSGRLSDSRRVRRGGRLVLAEDFALDGDVADRLDRPALGGGGRASAVIVLVAPEAEARLDAVRPILDRPDIAGGASAWNGLLTVRALSPSPERLRLCVAALLPALLRGRPLPRLWG